MPLLVKFSQFAVVINSATASESQSFLRHNIIVIINLFFLSDTACLILVADGEARETVVELYPII